MDKATDKQQHPKDADTDVIKRVLGGDANAFKILQRRYNTLVHTVVRKMIKDDDDADDIVQETFIKTYMSLHTYNPDYGFRGWLYRIASNCCIDFLRKRKFMYQIDTASSNNDDEDQTVFDVADFSYMPDSELLAIEKYDVIHREIDKLPEKYREVVILRHEEEMSYQEISQLLGMPMGTIKTMLFRARRLLEGTLKKYPELFNK
jgi:RNA polymerase sigma-70 factor (ECF subfamily)